MQTIVKILILLMFVFLFERCSTTPAVIDQASESSVQANKKIKKENEEREAKKKQEELALLTAKKERERLEEEKRRQELEQKRLEEEKRQQELEQKRLEDEKKEQERLEEKRKQKELEEKQLEEERLIKEKKLQEELARKLREQKLRFDKNESEYQKALDEYHARREPIAWGRRMDEKEPARNSFYRKESTELFGDVVTLHLPSNGVYFLAKIKNPLSMHGYSGSKRLSNVEITNLTELSTFKRELTDRILLSKGYFLIMECSVCKENVPYKKSRVSELLQKTTLAWSEVKGMRFYLLTLYSDGDRLIKLEFEKPQKSGIAEYHQVLARQVFLNVHSK